MSHPHLIYSERSRTTGKMRYVQANRRINAVDGAKTKTIALIINSVLTAFSIIACSIAPAGNTRQ